MDVIAEIRRRRLVSKESISSIARDLKLSRPTVRKHCRTERDPVYRRDRQPTPMLGAFQERLEAWLRTERLLPKAQRRTAQRLFEGLQAEGYRCAYQQHLRAPSPARRDLPQGAQWLPLRMGRRDLRRLPLRRQHRKGQLSLGSRHRPLRAGSQATRGQDRRGGVSNYEAGLAPALFWLRSTRQMVSKGSVLESYVLCKIRSNALFGAHRWTTRFSVTGCLAWTR